VTPQAQQQARAEAHATALDHTAADTLDDSPHQTLATAAAAVLRDPDSQSFDELEAAIDAARAILTFLDPEGVYTPDE
jgi:uncharacterized protein involved in copper resistance